MNPIRSTVCAAAALLALAACGAGDVTDPDPGVSATSTSGVSTAPSPVPTNFEPTAGSSGPVIVPSGAVSLADSCRAVLDDQRDAAAMLATYARNPLSGDVSVEDLDHLRSELLAGEQLAPEPLRRELGTQVAVLAAAVQGIREGNVQQLNVDGFKDAQQRITTLCADAGQ